MKLNKDVCELIGYYINNYELLDWIDINKLDWSYLSSNEHIKAIELLKDNPKKICWSNLSENKR